MQICNENHPYTNILKGIGTAGDSLGKFIGRIPVVRNGPVDELLQSGGNKLKSGVGSAEAKMIETFASISNPETRFFTEKLDDLIQIYDKTNAIYFDDQRIYLVSA